MDQKIIDAVECYQCPGCALGSDISCYKKANDGIGCGAHVAGTRILPGIGLVLLGMPKGFNRLGVMGELSGGQQVPPVTIWESYAIYGGFNKWNVPVWKHLDQNGHTLVRYLSPRVNFPGIYVFLENCMDQIDCFEVDTAMIEAMH